MKRLNQTESPIFVILCVLCFERQSCFTFISILYRSAKSTDRPFKCMTGYGSIECLGHNIVGQTVRPKEDKM